MKRFLSLIAAGALCLSANALTITQTQGWFESGCVKWAPVTGATDYNVYVSPSTNESWTKLDKELVRQYPGYYRADAVGLKAGDYKFKVEAVKGSSVMSGETATSDTFKATAHDRSGFAHVGMPGGVGAYKNDGTLKDGAKVLYVWADNAKTVTHDVITSSKGATTTGVGLQDIIYLYQKGYDTTPLSIRIIGTIKAGDMDRFDSSAEGLQVKGNDNYSEMPITIEGIGDDAAISGFGILVRGCMDTEFRNFAIMLCMDDCLSLDTANSHVWVHNMDFFYGNTGGDADQAKGDGTVDIKGKSTHITVSYNHFYDSGKCSLGGMKSETTDCWMTYHHNWFDHSDSRHPRIRTAFYHVYNNYYDGNAKYGVGVTYGGSSFVEKNYFRNCKYPMLISKQGTDAEGDGTFSGETGGVIKAYNNYITGAKQVLYYDGSQTNGRWDAVLVENRDDQVSAKAYSGGSAYNATADLNVRASSYLIKAMDAAENVPAIVTGELGAGRMNHGDFHWTFGPSEDSNYGVIKALKDALNSYRSTLVGFANNEAIKNGGADSTVDGDSGSGDGEGTPSWGEDGDNTESDNYAEEPYIIGADGDYYWFNAENAEEVNAWLKGVEITILSGSEGKTSFVPDYTHSDTSNGLKTDRTGSIQLSKSKSNTDKVSGGSCTFYCPLGVTTFELYTYRTGSTYYYVQTSTDGKTFTTVDVVDKAPKGIYEKEFSSKVRNKEGEPIWIRIVNTSTGGLNIQGVKINQFADVEVEKIPSDITAKTKIVELEIDKTITYQLTAADYQTASNGEIAYSSSNEKVVRVDQSGLITIVGVGNAIVKLFQYETDTYQAGACGIEFSVIDGREESVFALASEANVSLKMGESESSQIAIEGAAGAVTYKSSNPSVATVSDAGLITAKGAGEATITISDAGSETVKPGTPLSVKVTVEAADEEGGDEGDIEDDPTSAESVICHFTGKNISSDMVKLVSGDYSDSKGTVTYDGTEYKYCIKMESKTNITITPSFDCMVTLIFDATDTKLNLDGKSYSTDANNEYSFDGTAGTSYTLKKGGIMNLYLVVFTPKSSESESLEGDVDGNGKVEQADAELLVKILLEQEKATEGANVDGSEEKENMINVADLTKLIEILKKEVTLPWGGQEDEGIAE